MQSVIIASYDLEKGLKKAQDYAVEKKIGKFDLQVLEFEKDMGIPDVRLLKSKIFLKPLGVEKAVIIKLNKGMTAEAQNAMLKILEEPPPSANLIMIAQSSEIFLPTIISRCIVWKIDHPREDKKNKDLKILEDPELNEGFSIAQNISKDKGEAVEWLEDAIAFCKKKAEEEIRRGEFDKAKIYAGKLL